MSARANGRAPARRMSLRLRACGEAMVADEQDLLDWVLAAEPGARAVYATGPYLPACPVARRARALFNGGMVHLCQRRDSDGDLAWLAERRPQPRGRGR